MNKRKLLDFTDNELNQICRSINSYISNRETFLTKGDAIIINNAIKKNSI